MSVTNQNVCGLCFTDIYQTIPNFLFFIFFHHDTLTITRIVNFILPLQVHHNFVYKTLFLSQSIASLWAVIFWGTSRSGKSSDGWNPYKQGLQKWKEFPYQCVANVAHAEVSILICVDVVTCW